MLEFPYRNLLEKFEYNQNMLADDLSRRTQEYDRLSDRLTRAENFKLPIADRIFGETIRSMLKNSIESQKEKLDGEWQQVYDAKYPFVCDHMGKHQDVHTIRAELTASSESKDGWYHVPDSMRSDKRERDAVKQFEAECEKLGKRIPYAVGKRLETLFLDAQSNHQQIWAHRTGLSIDGGDLASIAKHGLAVPAQGHGEDELPELGYTATKISMTTNGFLHLLRATTLEEYKQMRGTVICLTDQAPSISRGYLDPGQVVGYVARDQGGHVCKMLNLSEMAQCHNTKTVLKDNREVEIDRKSNMDLDAHDYYQCQIPGIPEKLCLVNDSYDGNVMDCSIIYDGHIYGNLSLFTSAKNLTFGQAKDVKTQILQFGHELELANAKTLDGTMAHEIQFSEEERDRRTFLHHDGQEEQPSLLDELNAGYSVENDKHNIEQGKDMEDEQER